MTEVKYIKGVSQFGRGRKGECEVKHKAKVRVIGKCEGNGRVPEKEKQHNGEK